MCTSKLRTKLLAAAIILISACSTRSVSKLERYPQTSFQELPPPPGASRYTLKPGEAAIRPVLAKQVAPVYPPSLVHRGATPVTVVAKLVMDEQGNVKAVYPVSDTVNGSSGALFETAVEQAAMQWTFTPLWIQKARKDGTYLRTQEPFSLRYRFEFQVIDGKPTVEMGKR